MCKHERVLIELKKYLTTSTPGEDHGAKARVLRTLASIEVKIADEMQFEARKEKAVQQANVESAQTK